ncbi:type VI secretion system baseplate subunit TssK [Sansalvadorimonas sp. 2012CJ34-2]|uniref:Type VI secretion system baseplate subunit TssK n=1 Tax=Parendozoicomonas callyspongiae TaxID=2942213 RepID=A0ABT0PBV6_9GAMM|nr:type VI secretion system baseplate subunit TssK [Sansalvadorimonas sp. 2012CJ34-2]MCL6268829.1 type VI secretion system baseplate subunit TssK [Sansalvadorimonas sp. 2012CJ34-2]
MIRIDPVAWLEGAYVSPQHFQQQERYYENYISRFFYLQHPGEFGFSELVIAKELLRIGKFAIRQAEGIFSDMTPFVLNQQLVIDIPEDYKDSYVYLVIPLSRQGDQEIGSSESDAGRYRYHLYQEELIDNTNIHNPSVNVHIARPHISLMHEGKDLSLFAYLPVAKVKNVDSNCNVILDHQFIPPILNIHLSEYIDLWMQNYLARLTQQIDILRRRLTEGSNYKSPHTQYKDQLWLISIAQWETILVTLVESRQVNPRMLYITLRSLAGTLAGLTLTSPPPPKELNPYKLNNIFQPLFEYLSESMQDAGAEWIEELTIIKENLSTTGLLEYQLPRMHDNDRLIIAVQEARLLNLDSDASKYITIGPVSLIHQLVLNAEPGVPLKRPATPPLELNLTGQIFFEPLKSSSLFKQIINQEENLAVHLDEKLENTVLRIFLIRHQ